MILKTEMAVNCPYSKKAAMITECSKCGFCDGYDLTRKAVSCHYKEPIYAVGPN